VTIVQQTFRDLVIGVSPFILPSGLTAKVRLFLVDQSFIDIWLSSKGRYAYHWDRTLIGKGIYRHDNAPHQRWVHLSTFPKHFHDGSEDHIIESHLPDDPEQAVTSFLQWVRQKIVT
jgi:hypothetical protein